MSLDMNQQKSPSSIDNIILRIIEYFFVRVFLLIPIHHIIRGRCLLILILHRLVDAIAKETCCKNSRCNSDRFECAHFACPLYLGKH